MEVMGNGFTGKGAWSELMVACAKAVTPLLVLVDYLMHKQLVGRAHAIQTTYTNPAKTYTPTCVLSESVLVLASN